MSLHVYVGSMFSGKTSRMIQEVTKYSDISHKRPLVINHNIDDRNPTYVISSHSSMYKGLSCNVDVISTDRLSNVDVTNYTVIGIDEICFYPDLYETVLKWINDDKHIICSGLDGDARMKHFGQVADLLPIADEFIKLRAVCTICLKEKMNSGGQMTPLDITPAPFTCKIGGNPDAEIESGGADKYIAVCRKHHKKYSICCTNSPKVQTTQN